MVAGPNRTPPVAMPTAPLRQPPSWRWLLALAIAILVAHEVHELVHTGVGRLMCGTWGERDFNTWSLAPGCNAWFPTLAGPLASWGIMWVGVALLASPVESRRWTGLALVFAPNPLGRLLPALLGGGDEGVIARRLLGDLLPSPRIAVVLSALVFVIPPLVLAWRAFAPPPRAAWFVLLLASGILVTGPLLFVIGNGLLERGVLAHPGGLGAPLLIELVTVASVIALARQWRRLSAP